MQVVRRNGEIWVCQKSSPDLQNGQPRPLGMSYDTLRPFYVATLKSAESGIRYSRRKQQLASGCTGVCCVCRCCVTYVRGPDLKAGLHFSIRAQVGEFQLGLVCVGISGGNLSRQPGSTRVGTWVPTLPRSLRSTSVSGETVKGTCVSVEAHPR